MVNLTVVGLIAACVHGLLTRTETQMRQCIARLLAALLLGVALLAPAAAQVAPPMAQVDALLAANPGQTGVYVLDDPQEALLARAWLVEKVAEKDERDALPAVFEVLD